MNRLLVCVAIMVYMSLQTVADAKTLHGKAVFLPDGIIAVEDVSAVAMMGSFLILGSDEAVGGKNYIQLLQQDATGTYTLHRNILLSSDGEMDIEGLAVQGNTVYAIGSHASKRKKTSTNHSYKKNSKTFYDRKIADERSRDQLYRIIFDSNGETLKKTALSLRDVLADHPVLKTFSHIPSKENGIDIEALAVKDNWLYVGFRGPVFRANYVPILRLNFDDVSNKHTLLYVRLGGRGIRAMTEVADGFLLIAGPVGDGDASYQLYFWDGNTTLQGKKRHGIKRGMVRLLGEIIPPKHKKAEGIVLVQEDNHAYHLLIAYDGSEQSDGVVESFVVAKHEE